MKNKEILEKLTLEEKADLCTGKDFWHLNAVERLGIPSLTVTDGPHGLRLQDPNGNKTGLLNSVPATCFPTAATTACSWDKDLLYRMGEGFGAGMGTTLGVCGALSGAAMIAGLVYSDGNTEMAGQTKAKTTRMAGIMQKKFAERAKAIICREIKTGNNGSAYTSCNDCIRIATELVEEELGL